MSQQQQQQLFYSPAVPAHHLSGFDYDGIMNEVAVQMAASQLSRQSRYSYHTTPKRWSGRIEKPRSSHTSPAMQERRRAYSSTRPGQAPVYNLQGLNSYAHQMALPRSASRPFSWHPSSSHQFYTISPNSNMASPASTNYLPTPPNPFPATSIQQPMSNQMALMPRAYQGLPDFVKPHVPESISPELAYSTERIPSSSPSWQYVYDGKNSVMADSTRIPSISPPDPASWYDNSCSQVITAQPSFYQAPLPPILPQPSLSSMIQQESLLGSSADSETTDEDDGEVLVALGLYDRPDDIFTENKTLKLTEAWEPPEASDDEDSSQEDDDEVQTPGPGQSWFDA